MDERTRSGEQAASNIACAKQDQEDRSDGSSASKYALKNKGNEGSEKYALSKEEAKKFQTEIKKYYDQCVRAEKSCRSTLQEAEGMFTK